MSMVMDFTSSSSAIDNRSSTPWKEYFEGESSMANSARTRNPKSTPSKKIRKNNRGSGVAVETTVLTDDGHGWRKYGQKNIQFKPYPRNYYRCTHHKDDKCKAKKQTQQLSEHPPLYRTTYFGHHTCRNPNYGYSTPLQEDSLADSSYRLLCFDLPSKSSHDAVRSSNFSSSSSSSSSGCDPNSFFGSSGSIQCDFDGLSFESRPYVFPSMENPNNFNYEDSCDLVMMVDEWFNLHPNPSPCDF